MDYPNGYRAGAGDGRGFQPSSADAELMRRAIEAADNRNAMRRAAEEFPQMKRPVGEHRSPLPGIPAGKPFTLPPAARALRPLLRLAGPVGQGLSLAMDLYDLYHLMKDWGWQSPFRIDGHPGWSSSFCNNLGSGNTHYRGFQSCNGNQAITWAGLPVVDANTTRVGQLKEHTPGHAFAYVNTHWVRAVGAPPFWAVTASPTDDPAMIDWPAVDPWSMPAPAPASRPSDPHPDPAWRPGDTAPEKAPEQGVSPSPGIPGGGDYPSDPFVRYGRFKGREIKIRVGAYYKLGLTAFDSASEARDFVRGLWSALPRHEKTLTDQQKIPVSKRNPAYKVGQQTITQMMQDIYNAKTPWVDYGAPGVSAEYWNKALTNVIENQVSDYLFGRFGRKGAEASAAARTHGSVPIGLQRGTRWR